MGIKKFQNAAGGSGNHKTILLDRDAFFIHPEDLDDNGETAG